jgi:hypothetical protein
MEYYKGNKKQYVDTCHPKRILSISIISTPMKLLLACLAFFLTRSFTLATNPAFVSTANRVSKTSVAAMNDENNNDTPCTASPHPFTMLPGDPSLILTTNVNLGDKKLEIMKGKYAGNSSG